METNLHCKSQLFLLPLNPISMKGSSLQSGIRIHLNKSQTQKLFVFSRKKRTRNGSRRLVKFVLETIPIVASRLKILPQPLDMIVGELSGAGGGGSGSGGGWGFGRSSGDGWFEGWRRRGAGRKLGFWLAVLVFGLGLVMGRGTDRDSMYWVWGFGLVSLALTELWRKKAIRDGMLGFCCLGVLAVLGMRPEVKNWVRDFRVSSPLTKSFRRGGRRRRSL